MQCEEHTMPMPYALLGGDATLIERLTRMLAQAGYRLDPRADLVVLLDAPRGYALPLLEERPPPRCLVITANACPDYGADLWEQGIAGLVVANSFDEEIVTALHTVAAGGSYRTGAVASALTPAERAVLRRLASSWSDQAIAEVLHLSKGTVMNRVSDILSKLGCANRTEAALWYWGVQPIFLAETHARKSTTKR